MNLTIIFMLATFSYARTVAHTRDVWASDAKSALEAQGFLVDDAYAVGDVGYIVLPDSETRDPLPVINAIKTRSMVAADRAAILDELAAIEERIDSGTETAADRRRFMKIILKLNGWTRRP